MLELSEVQIYIRESPGRGKMPDLRQCLSGGEDVEGWSGDCMSEQRMCLRETGTGRSRDRQLIYFSQNADFGIRCLPFSSTTLHPSGLLPAAAFHKSQIRKSWRIECLRSQLLPTPN